MHYRACVISKDPDFSQFVRLTLLTRIRPVTVCSDGDIPSSDIYIVDFDTCPLPTLTGGTILLCASDQTRPNDCPYLWADRPFRPARLLALLELTEDTSNALMPYTDRPAVLVGDEEVALSAREHALLLALWDANGTYLSREELLLRVWGDEETDMGVVNVYIHYLRRKLEKNGHRYIYAARGRGYKLEREETTC